MISIERYFGSSFATREWEVLSKFTRLSASNIRS
jgi:hypothetical protein